MKISLCERHGTNGETRAFPCWPPSRQNSWREHKHAAIRVSAVRKGPADAADGGRCRRSFTFRYPVDGNRAAARQLSLLYIFSSPRSLSLSLLFLFLFSFVHLDTSASFSPFEKFSPRPHNSFYEVETKQLYETNASGRPSPSPVKDDRRGIESGGERSRRNVDEDKK